MIWNEEREKMDRQRLQELQFELLRAQLERAYELVPFYRQAMRQRGLRPADIRSLEDLPLLPFTRKADFADNYPFGLLAVPKRHHRQANRRRLHAAGSR
jgi:phenylacetate-CoA ligase